VEAGHPFEVVIPVGKQCERPAGVRVQELSPDSIEVAPYDSILVGKGLQCLAFTTVVERKVTIRLPRPGNYVVSIRGRIPGTTQRPLAIVNLQYTVVAR
jgi:hypothetical protein